MKIQGPRGLAYFAKFDDLPSSCIPFSDEHFRPICHSNGLHFLEQTLIISTQNTT